jgi:hypothetical protein
MTFGSFRLNTLSAALAPTYISATGGTISYVSSGGIGYKCHTFSTAGTNTFTVTSSGNNLEAIIVGAGGGSGGLTSSGTSQGSGGGGGGQYRLQTGISVTAQGYSIVTGAAGTAGGNGTNGGFGSSSSAFGFTSVGGAGSKGDTGSTPATAGAAGGSGGGFFAGGIANNGTAGTLAGGNAANGGTGTTQGAGGGGSNVSAGSNGNISPGLGGTGASGTITSFNGSSLNLGGGGGGAGPAGADSSSGGVGADFFYGEGATGVYSNSGVVLGNAGRAGAVLIRYPIQTAFAVNFITSDISTTSTITIPATAAIGDIAIIFDYGYITSTTAPTAVTPTNWTSIASVSNTTSPSQRLNVSYKTLVSGDPGSSITGVNTTSMRKIILIYRPTLTPNTITPTLNFSTSTASAVSNQFLTLNTAKTVLSFAAYCTSGASISTRPSSRSATQEIANSTNMYVKTFEDQTGTNTTNTISLADNGTNTLAIFNIMFT